MWPFRKKVRFVDLLKRHFGEGPDGPLLIASGSEFVRPFPWVRFTFHRLDYCVERDRSDYGHIVQVGRADRAGRPADISAFDRLSLGEMQAYNRDMFYWDLIEWGLGGIDTPDVRHSEFEEVLATLSRLECRLQALFSGEAYAALRAEQTRRIELVKADLARNGQLGP